MGLRSDNTRTGFAFNSGMGMFQRTAQSGIAIRWIYQRAICAGILRCAEPALSPDGVFVDYQYWSAGNVVIDSVTTGGEIVFVMG